MLSKSAAPDPRLSRYDHVIVHVTATNPTQDFDDKDIDKMHRKRGFASCGYNALIKRDGTWLDSDMGAVTRPIGKQGAHVGGCGPGWNGRSFGVSLVGGVDETNRPDFNMTGAQMDTLEDGIMRILDLHPRGRGSVRIMGHRDLIRETDAAVKKACPCFDVIPWWDGVLNGEDDSGDDEDPFGFGSLVDQPAFWTVASGDSLSNIVKVTGVSLQTIRQLNPDITNIDLIAVGQIIRLS